MKTEEREFQKIHGLVENLNKCFNFQGFKFEFYSNKLILYKIYRSEDNYVFLLMGSLFLSLFILSTYGFFQTYPPSNLLDVVMVLTIFLSQILFLPLTLYCFIGYFHERNRKTEIEINLTLNKIKHKKISPKYKELRNINISDINFVYYHNYSGAYGMVYSRLELSLINKRKFKILFSSNLEGIRKLGNVISGLIKKPLQDKGYKKWNFIIPLIIVIFLFTFLIIAIILT